MTVTSHDQGFVAAPPEEVFEVLADLRSYPDWWPGPGASLEADVARLKARPWGGAAVRSERRRPGVGLFLRFEGAPEGTLEWYLEPFDDGTIVNAIIQVNLPDESRKSSRWIRRARVSAHAGLAGLRQWLEGRSERSSSRASA